MLKGQSIKCSLNTVGMNKPIHTKYVMSNVDSLVNDETFAINHVLVVPDIPAESPPGELTLSDYPYLVDVSFGPLAVGTMADLLIANDNPDLLVPLDVRRTRCEVRQPYATLTRLGWVLQGPVKERLGDESSMQVNHVMMDRLVTKWRSCGMLSDRMSLFIRGLLKINRCMTCGRQRQYTRMVGTLCRFLGVRGGLVFRTIDSWL